MTTHNARLAERHNLALAFSHRHIKACMCDGGGWIIARHDPATGDEIGVGHPLFGEPIPCICTRDADAKRRAERLRATSGMSTGEMAQWQFAGFHPEQCRGAEGIKAAMGQIKEICECYARDPQGWLIIQGAPGTGKTHLAYAIAGACIHADRAAYAATVPDLLQRLRESFSEDGLFDRVLEDLRNVDVLVLDDLGAQRTTDWTIDTLYQIVNHRYARRLPLVVTTNLDLAVDGSGLDPRLLSRFREGSKRPDGWVRLLSVPAADFRPYRPGRTV